MQKRFTWKGSGTGTLHVDDQRTFMERWSWVIIRLAILAAIAIVILGYIPPIKKYLPKNLQSSPRIELKAKQIASDRSQQKERWRRAS